MKRLLIALLIAPLWCVLAAMAYGLLLTMPDFWKDMSRTEVLGMSAMGGALLGYAAMLVLGLPSYKILQWRSRHSLRAYLATWFIAGVIGWLVVFLAGWVTSGAGFALSYLGETVVKRPFVPLRFGVLWAVVGVTFWAIIRPDRRHAALLPETFS